MYEVPTDSPAMVARPADNAAVVVAPPGLAVTRTSGSRHGQVVVSAAHAAVAEVPSAVAVMAVGEVTVSQIQSRAADTRAYTPGDPGSPQRRPQLTTPTCTGSPPAMVVIGPPESPEQVSLRSGAEGGGVGPLPAQIMLARRKSDPSSVEHVASVSSGMPPDTLCRIVAVGSLAEQLDGSEGLMPHEMSPQPAMAASQAASGSPAPRVATATQ